MTSNTPDTPDLLACPLCARNDLLHPEVGPNGGGLIKCWGCGAQSGERAESWEDPTGRAKIIAAWNRRPNPPLASDAEIEGVAREIAQRIVDDANRRVVCLKPLYDSVDLGATLIARAILSFLSGRGLGVSRDHDHTVSVALEELRLFLNGEGELDGYSFGVRPASQTAFWWRKHLPVMATAARLLSSPAQVVGESSRDEPPPNTDMEGLASRLDSMTHNRCRQIPTEVVKDCKAAAQALRSAEARAKAGEEESAALTKALTGLTCGGSEFFIRKGDRYVADIGHCVDWVRRRDQSAAQRALTAMHERKAAEAKRLAAEAANAGLARPITWQDVRLAVGEGPLKNQDVLAGCNAELRRRAALAASPTLGGD